MKVENTNTSQIGKPIVRKGTIIMTVVNLHNNNCAVTHGGKYRKRLFYIGVKLLYYHLHSGVDGGKKSDNNRKGVSPHLVN